MKWDNDPYRDQKRQIFDAIVALGNYQDRENFGSLTVRQLNDFIDKFFDDLSVEANKKKGN